MIKFLLICPTSALEKIFNPQNILYINLWLKIVSALNLNKFPKNLMIEYKRAGFKFFCALHPGNFSLKYSFRKGTGCTCLSMILCKNVRSSKIFAYLYFNNSKVFAYLYFIEYIVQIYE